MYFEDPTPGLLEMMFHCGCCGILMLRLHSFEDAAMLYNDRLPF
jgi:hypothetical protein